MEPFKHIKFEYSLPERLKSELIFAPGQEEKLVDFMNVAKGMMVAIQETSQIEKTDKELILSSLIAGNLFGLFDQEERLRIASSIFLGMMLNSFLVSEGIYYNAKISGLESNDIEQIRNHLCAVAIRAAEKTAADLRCQVNEIYAPLKDFPITGDTESDEDPSLS